MTDHCPRHLWVVVFETLPLNSTAASQSSCGCCLGAVVMVMLTWFLLTWENQVWNQIFKILDGKQMGKALLPFFQRNFFQSSQCFYKLEPLLIFAILYHKCFMLSGMHQDVLSSPTRPHAFTRAQHKSDQITQSTFRGSQKHNSCSIWCVKMNTSWCVQDSSEEPPTDLSIIHGTKTRFFW